MSMQVGSGGGEDEVIMDINTTPLIDVMLVLIIMLIITIPIQTHAVKLNMPVGPSTPPLRPPEIVRIDIDFDGTIAWNGSVIADRSDLEQRFSGVARKAEQDEIHIAPNKLAEYKYVAMVMASAQRLGVTKIGLVGNEQFMN